MNGTSFVELFHNAALLLAIAFIFDVTAGRLRTAKLPFLKVLAGFAIGIIGITVMMSSWKFSQGIVFDTRSVVLGISGLFFGPLPTSIAMAMTAAFRFHLGGTGTWTGIAVILSSGTIGLTWRHYFRRPLAGIHWYELYLFGMLVHLVMLALMFTMPWETALRTLTIITLPIILIYPLGTALLGMLIVNRLRHELAEEAISKSEEKFRKAFYTSPDSVNINRLEDGKYVSINPGFTRITGYTEKDIIGKTSIECNIWDDPKDRQRLVDGLKNNGEVHNHEAVFRMKGGETLYGLMSASVIDLNGIPHILSITRNITERKKAQETLEKNERKYRLLADNVRDVIFVLDMNLNYTYVSPSIKLLRGYEPSEVLKQPGVETLTPSSWELAMSSLSEVMALENAGEREDVMSRTLELEMKRRDGTTVWTEVRFSFIRDENQKAVGILGVTRDIDVRKRTEDALRESENRYRELIDGMNETVWVIDFNGDLIDVNKTAVETLGYSKEDLIATGLYGIDSSLKKEDIKALAGAMPSDKIQIFETSHTARDGRTFPVEVYSSLVTYQGRQSILSIARNITERKQAEKHLQDILENLRKAIGTTVKVMVSAVEARDPYTAGHQYRSADLARAIAIEMGLPADKVDGIFMAGSIHDIGKLSVPAEILAKPIKLTEIEFSIVKEHPQKGYDILKDVQTDWPLAEIVYQHHERMDGSGYPRGLKGNEILIESRILAVADVVESMASHRPYRPALGIEAAFQEIEDNKDLIYDGPVVDACLRLFKEKNYHLPQNIDDNYHAQL